MKRVELLKKEKLLILLIIVEFVILNSNYSVEDFINNTIIVNGLFYIAIIGMILNFIKKEKNEMYGRNMFCYAFMLQYWSIFAIYSITRCFGPDEYHQKLVFTKTLINLMFLIEHIIYYFLINKKLVFKILLFILSIVTIFGVNIMLFRSMGDPHSVTPIKS